MKKTLITLVGLLMAVCANAQLSRSVSEQLHTHVQEYDIIPTGKYNRYYFGGKIRTLNASDEDGYDFDPVTGGGVLLGWTHGKPITKNSLPLYLESGVRLALGGGEGSDNDFDKQMVFISAMVPLNLTYRLKIGEQSYFSPFVGFYATLGAIMDEWYFNGMSDYDLECNIPFDFGMQLGANLDLKKFHIGLSWQPSFINRTLEGSKYEAIGHMNDVNITIGWFINKSKKVKKS